MPDVWATVTNLDSSMQERLAGMLEARGADPRQQAMRRAFLSGIDFPADAHVVDVGCGTGVLTRMLARWPNVDKVVGVDPAASLIREPQVLASDLANVTFNEADGRSLPFGGEAFDVAIFDSTLSHVPGPVRALAEAHRVLRPAGWLAVFDGDYATSTVELCDHDPLQTCVAAMMANSVNDRWLMRRLCRLVRDSGFDIVSFHSHGFSETTGGAYMLSVVDRGADILSASGTIGEETASAMKSEARRRVNAGTFFGHIAYASLIARKPVTPA
ncbi:methyltransferase domain-containing protein [Mesorhizobium sp.]|uniref:methyltransferase domain-containing protein n=1 Tax=Mesorhizobium sp. TaxID=1871066 RepID=UPI0012056E87|nr:methyltransferase domain-containing protein [Mesorhizobium sp.]TIP10393.1 MAG: methyltransferase domain-containing protein [Mesorhizobium sp.]